MSSKNEVSGKDLTEKHRNESRWALVLLPIMSIRARDEVGMCVGLVQVKSITLVLSSASYGFFSRTLGNASNIP